ncbi:hypothetical protein CK203_045674 [Vitis vinifera]|uniref:Uncharacterized protein n=1 Tax=Vitis vinifera TaxID=29760 RepID=A0A438HQ73_VITVI|nr:hypothetical protein CK203_045674 [Vitis vinifera]
MVINFVDYSLNQGAPAGHKSAETPIGHESNGAVAGDRTSNQMVPLPMPLLGTNHKAIISDGEQLIRLLLACLLIVLSMAKRAISLWKLNIKLGGQSKVEYGLDQSRSKEVFRP